MIRRMRRLLIVTAVLLFAGSSAAADAVYRFTGVGRVVAFADVHGAYSELTGLLRETGVVDESLRWRAGETRLVSTGDLVDRGPDSRKVMDLLMRLEDEARQAGGAVHVLLGNHEVMNIAGDLRYVSAAEYAAFAGGEDTALREEEWKRTRQRDPAASRPAFDAAFPAGYFAHRQAFSAEGSYGAWLRSRPFLIVINDTAFVHAGLPPMVARLGLEGTNRALHSQLDEYLRTWDGDVSALNLSGAVAFLDQPEAVAAAGSLERSQVLSAMQERELFTPAGPTWYRGQALCYPYAETENLDAALARLGAVRVVEGHTVSPTGRVLSRFDDRVILLDAGMLKPVYGGSAAALVLENERLSVAYAGDPTARVQPEALPRAVGQRPRGLSDDVLERWLAEAEIVSVEELDSGITEPQRITLRKDGVELRAVFKQLSTDFGIEDRRRAIDEADRFEYEIAAYRLDRLLGLDMLPVTVARTIGGHRGILQFWIDESINLRQMLERKLAPAGWCDTAAQYNLMNVFDFLIHNTDRTQENALFTRDWMLVLIDHSRAFATPTKAPRLLYQNGVYVPPALAARLAALDRPSLDAALAPYLRRQQIDALLKRRDRLLREYRVAPASGRAVSP